MLRRHVLVIEGHHVATAGKPAQVTESAVVADDDVRGDQGGAVVGRLGEQAHRLAQRNCGLMGHSGQLAGPDHADDGQSGAGVHSL